MYFFILKSNRYFFLQSYKQTTAKLHSLPCPCLFLSLSACWLGWRGSAGPARASPLLQGEGLLGACLCVAVVEVWCDLPDCMGTFQTPPCDLSARICEPLLGSGHVSVSASRVPWVCSAVCRASSRPGHRPESEYFHQGLDTTEGRGMQHVLWFI